MFLPTWLDRLDKILFLLIHHDSDHSILDNIMLLLRNPYTWIPLYAFIFIYVIRSGKYKVWPFIFLSLITFSLTDSISASVLKPFFGRLRPCFEPQLQGMIRNITDCGGLYSFPSSHACNHFGLTTFWFMAIFTLSGKKWKWLWIWAALISYAQVYVGKHYPLDVMAGALLGITIGGLSGLIFRLWVSPAKKTRGKKFEIENKLEPSLT